MYKGVRQILVPGLKRNTKKDMTASEGSLFFKDELTENNSKSDTKSHNKKESTTTKSTETTVRDTMNTINPNVTSSSSSSLSDSNNKKESSSSSSSETETVTPTQKGMTEMSADSKSIMRALAQETDSKSMSRSKSNKSNKESKKSKRHLKNDSSSLSSSVSSMKVSEGGMSANLSAKNKNRLKKLPANYFDLAPEGLVQQMMNEGADPPQGMVQQGHQGTNPMRDLLEGTGEMGPPGMQPGMGMGMGMVTGMPPGMLPGSQGMPQGMPAQYPPQGMLPPGMMYQQPGSQGMSGMPAQYPPQGMLPPGMPGMGMTGPQQGGGNNEELKTQQKFKLNFF